MIIVTCNGKLNRARGCRPVKTKHEHTCNGFLADAFESFQLSLDLFICALPQMLQAALPSF